MSRTCYLASSTRAKVSVAGTLVLHVPPGIHDSCSPSLPCNSEPAAHSTHNLVGSVRCAYETVQESLSGTLIVFNSSKHVNLVLSNFYKNLLAGNSFPFLLLSISTSSLPTLPRISEREAHSLPFLEASEPRLLQLFKKTSAGEPPSRHFF